MRSEFVCANTLSDVLRAYMASRAACQDGAKLRCVHTGALAGALAVCDVDYEVALASLCALNATAGALDGLAALALPSNAHIKATGQMVIVCATADGISAIRRWKTRDDLLQTIQAATAPMSWVPGSSPLWTAYEIRGARAVRASHPALIHPTGPHPVAPRSIALSAAAVESARAALTPAPRAS
jgi:hypothetical protein